jgi:RNA polymerase sigma-70 factor (ECF subfamily)
MEPAPAAISDSAVQLAPLELVGRGHPNAVAELYDALAPALYGYVASLTRRGESAEEIVQESFVRLVAAVRAGRVPDDPRAWVYRVATNLAVSRSRRRSIVQRWLPILVSRGEELLDEAAEETVLRRERDHELRIALRALSGEQRAALLLAADGFSGREIAEILHRSEGATRNILWRSRLALRDRLEGGRR